MSRIRRLAPRTCPHCGAQNTLFIDLERKLKCRLCGHVVSGDSPPKEPKLVAAMPSSVPAVVPPKKRYHVTYTLITPYEVDAWARSAYHTALEHLERGRPDDAIPALRRALDAQPDFLDAHLWLGRLLDDPAEKRRHYETIVSKLPNHTESIRELMVLSGQMTPEEAERARLGGGRVRTAEVPVAAVVKTTECPVCGGEMRAAHDGSSTCRFCGYHVQAPREGDWGLKSFNIEMLRRRGQKERWEVGERLLQCKSCGAQTLLQPQTLTVRCPFCGSRGVVETDALRSFVKPDSLLPFTLSEAEARKALEAALNSRMERIKGLFVNNRVASILITSVYLPFWLFDLTLRVSITIENRRAAEYFNEQVDDSVLNVPVCGVESPPRTLTDRLKPYALDQLRPYHPDLLAGCTAELYTLDFDAASLLARERVSAQMRQKYNHGEHDDVTTTVMSLVQMMYFRLVLLPVYVVTVIEQDGDHRSALVHGETGQVVLGVAARP